MTDGVPAIRTPKKRLDAFETVFQVALLMVRRSMRGWRLVAALAVILLPSLLAWIVRWEHASETHRVEFFYGVLGYYQFGIATPIFAMLAATAFPWPEAEEGTLSYWFTSPVRRWAVLLGRYVAAVFVGTLMLPFSVVALAASLDLPESAEAVRVGRAAITCTLLVFPAYLALFQFVSTLLRRGLVMCVVFVLFENFISIVPGNAVKLALVYYVRSMLLPAIPESAQRQAAETLQLVDPATTGQSLAVFGSVTLVALGLSLLSVELIEYRGRTAQPG